MSQREQSSRPTDNCTQIDEAIKILVLFRSQVGREWFTDKTGQEGFDAAVKCLRKIAKLDMFHGK